VSEVKTAKALVARMRASDEPAKLTALLDRVNA
jgi:hypothetical protein